ncbi:sulfite exporter TauE/SafE family protein [Pseudogracilibacillus auburnensis]|uniref:sulfite exporter TauE/SafE family protein n=1 Tax=Pseudogracilibacillus auburnensis TaxID=1494959 RepID=UPI0027DA7357|nr:sulfite exporter TauE/SafE family protein [Pseudogracilibacillus auburnensis]
MICLVIIIALLIGFLSAFVGSLVGLGGGIVLVPAMLFLYDNFSSFSWANPQAIVGISLITMVFTGLSSTLAYYRLKRVDIKTGVIFLIGSLPGSVVGSWINTRLETDQFSLYFGILMIIIFIMMLVDREKLRKNKPLEITDQTRTFMIDGETHQYNITYVPAIILSFAVGLLSGLFGIGGGTISVPAMILFFGIPVQIAIATSMFMIFFISIISASAHIVLGHIVWSYVLFFVIGSYIGGTVGAKTSKLFKGKTLEWILRIVIVIAAIRLIIESFH